MQFNPLSVRRNQRSLLSTVCFADHKIDNQSFPSTPGASQSILFIDSITKKFCQMDDSGHVNGSPLSRNSSIASQALTSVDTYINGSNLLLPTFGMQVGQIYRWIISLSKTAAGNAAAIVNIRIGAAGAIGDTAQLILTQ